MTPSRNASCTIYTTFSHLVGSLSSPPSVIPSSLIVCYRPSGPDVSPTASVSASAAASAALCSRSYSRICLTCIHEVPPDRRPRSLCTTHSTSSYIGIESLIGEGGTDVGIVSPPRGGYGTVDFLALRRDLLKCDSSWQQGVVYRFSIPPTLHPPPRFFGEGGIPGQ